MGHEVRVFHWMDDAPAHPEARYTASELSSGNARNSRSARASCAGSAACSSRTTSVRSRASSTSRSPRWPTGDSRSIGSTDTPCSRVPGRRAAARALTSQVGIPTARRSEASDWRRSRPVVSAADRIQRPTSPFPAVGSSSRSPPVARRDAAGWAPKAFGAWAAWCPLLFALTIWPSFGLTWGLMLPVALVSAMLDFSHVALGLPLHRTSRTARRVHRRERAAPALRSLAP